MSASTEQRNEPKKVYTKIKTKTLLDAMSNASQMARTNFKNRAEPLHDTYFFVYQTLQTFSSYVREGIIIMIPSDFSDTASCLDSLVPSLVYLATAAGRLVLMGVMGVTADSLTRIFLFSRLRSLHGSCSSPDGGGSSRGRSMRGGSRTIF